MDPGYQPRTYREDGAAPDLVSWRVVVAETDLFLQADRELRDLSLQAAREARAEVEREIARCPEFATSLHPLFAPEDASPVVAEMYAAAAMAHVGPLAAVAGALAHAVGRALLAECEQVIVENGGDLFLYTAQERVVAVLAGRSPLSGRVGISVPAGVPRGVCTSSGTVGPSYSAGRADAAVILAESAALADAAASGLGNRVLRPDDCEDAVAWAREVPGVLGALVICGAQLAAAGDLRLQRLPGPSPSP